MPVIMGTAGHIDHGKTTLIKALTGIDCDRLSEEKRRGITIELGFAFMDLPDGTRLGIVDVPGHERFVKNMVAGAGGIDFVLLVVAADEGVMPQTREHLEICSLLGIKTGLVALTKVDAVDQELLDLVREDVREFLEPTFLAQAPVIPVSSLTGVGLDELRAELAGLAGSVSPQRGPDLFRLPIDRVFTMRGHGTVITGTLVSGSVSLGDDIVVYPRNRATKVRGLQVHGESQPGALAGQRTAVNLAGLEVEDVARGEVLAHPGTLFPSTQWDLELTCLKSSPHPIRHRREVHFHHGTKDILARLYFFDRDKLVPGDTAVCRARFAEPMVGVYGDRCVIRAFSPLRTIAGGALINPLGRGFKRRAEALDLLKRLVGADAREVLKTQAALAGEQGVGYGQLRILTGLKTKDLDKLLQDMGARREVVLFDKEARIYASGDLVEELTGRVKDFLAGFHKREPLKQGLGRGELASAWGRNLPPKLFHFVLERLVKAGEVVSEQEMLRLPGHKVSLASDQARLRDEILAAYEKGGTTPPNLKDVIEKLGIELREAAPVFRLLTEEGALVKVKEDMYFTARAVQDLKNRVVEYFRANQEMGPAELRDLTGLSRKYAVPLLEYLDKEKVTVRVGDKRRLRKK